LDGNAIYRLIVDQQINNTTKLCASTRIFLFVGFNSNEMAQNYRLIFTPCKC